MSSGFQYGKTLCSNLHDVVTLIKGFKTRDEGQLFLNAFRNHIRDTVNMDADLHLSKFLQRNYPEEQVKLHELLGIAFWEEPKYETIPSRESVGQKVGRKRRGLSKDT